MCKKNQGDLQLDDIEDLSILMYNEYIFQGK